MKSEFTRQELWVIENHRSPAAVQRYLRSLPYNWENTLRTFRQVVRHGAANCIEAALSAAAIMEQHGYPPLLLDLMSQDGLDHVLFLFNGNGRWGTVGKSRDLGLHGRRPVFRTIRDLVYSYVDPYVDHSGRLIGYGTVNLQEWDRYNWRFSERNVWAIEKALIAMPHKELRTSEARYRRTLEQFLRFKEKFPDRPYPYADRGGEWF